MTLKEKFAALMQKRGDLIEKMESVYKQENITEDLEKSFDEAEKALVKVNSDIERVQKLIAQEAQTIKPIEAEEGDIMSVTVEPEKLEKGEKFARLSFLVAKSGGNINLMRDIAAKKYGQRNPIVKTLVEGSTPGSVLVPTDYSMDIIDLLKNQAIVRASGVPVVGTRNGNLTMPKQTGSATASYVAENTAANASDQNATSVTWSNKKLTAVTAVSKELLSDNAWNVEGLIRNDIVSQLVLAEDSQLIRGTGSATAPTSIKAIATTETATSASADISAITDQVVLVQTIRNNLALAKRYLMNRNMSVVGAVWAMSPRTMLFLENLSDGIGGRAFPEILARGELMGHKIYVTNQIPENLGTGTNESEIYFYQPQGYLITDTQSMELSVTTEGSVQVGGSLVSCFANDLVALKVVSRADFNARYSFAGYYFSACKWGV